MMESTITFTYVTYESVRHKRRMNTTVVWKAIHHSREEVKEASSQESCDGQDVDAGRAVEEMALTFLEAHDRSNFKRA
ncbi:hypothetical protein OSB04_019188 [Centaurea solstitialis]|uniref:Uncharacterized protein n=1 Tax=Centaurea solstitialis TaxID=347529 RepID=A0AA38SPU1_9ASTR|nr:hypothetical protein OSB04_019188 [Centaurea solstitialis]